MKKSLLAILLLTSLISFSQNKKELEIKDFFWGANDRFSDKTEIPEKYNNESAVIIYKNENFDFHKYGKNVKYISSTRQRIKLLDKASVEEFSEFKFKDSFKKWNGTFVYKNKGTNVLGIKIIKSNGEIFEIDIDKEAIEVDGEKKIAIPNLEIGDIIDYYYHKTQEFKTPFTYIFDAVETTLGEEYPVIDYKLFIETENDFFLNFNTFNGAPELKEIATEKRNMRRYTLVSQDIPKEDYPRWFFPLIELPAFKLQAVFARSGKYEDAALAFLSETEKEIKSSVSEQEILDLYDLRFKADGKFGDLRSFIKNNTFKNDYEKVEQVYYYMRHYYMTRYIEAWYLNEINNNSYATYQYSDKSFYIRNERHFIKNFAEFLKKQKLSFEIVAAKKRYDGPIEDLLIEQNVTNLIKVNTSPPIYLTYFGYSTSANQILPSIENSNAYLLSSKKGGVLNSIKKGKLPNSTHLQNVQETEMKFSLNDDLTEIEFDITSSFRGHQKTEEQYDRLEFYDFVNEDYTKYNTKSVFEFFTKKKIRNEYKQKLDAYITKTKNENTESFKKELENSFDFIEVENYKFNILENGRYGFESDFTYNETFSTENNLIKKAGKNYIFNIGKLIGGQVDINKEEEDRVANINLNYAKSYNNTIIFNLPEGYSVVGLDKLNKNVDNETGAFISTAEVKKNQLIITTTKQYKSNFVENKDWSKMIDFLNEARQFTNEKILLKKI